jgi:hypothetical protein
VSGGGPPLLGFADAVRLAQSLNMNHAGHGAIGICGRCGDPIVKPFPTASKDIKAPHPMDLHDRFCDRIQVRKAKQRVIDRLVRELDVKLSKAAAGRGRREPTAVYIEDLFGRAWETSLLLGEDFDEHVARPSWQKLKDALKEEEGVLNLRVGEDQFGWGLVAYTRANIPTDTLTNGGVSLFIFGRRNPIRVWCTSIATSFLCDAFIMMCICASSLLLAVDDPRRPNSDTNAAMDEVGSIFTYIFITEMVIKVVAMGFVLHPTAYLRDPWNVLDFFIVIISIVDLALGSVADISFLKVLRTFRALRPLRVINRNRGLRMVVLTLIESVKGILNVAMITIIIWLVFAILGTQLFGGALYFCTDLTRTDRGNCTGAFFTSPTAENVSRTFWSNVTATSLPSANTTTTTTSTPYDLALTYPGYPYSFNGTLIPGAALREWTTYHYNFDNSYNSFLTLFVIATLDDWSTKMYYTIDSTDVDQGPEKNAHQVYALYFIVFIIVGSFFLLAFFVGVVIRQYNLTKDKLDGLSFLTPEQKHWVETQRMVLNFRPTRRNKPPGFVAIEAAVITKIDVNADVEEENNLVFDEAKGEYCLRSSAHTSVKSTARGPNDDETAAAGDDVEMVNKLSSSALVKQSSTSSAAAAAHPPNRWVRACCQRVAAEPTVRCTTGWWTRRSCVVARTGLGLTRASRCSTWSSPRGSSSRRGPWCCSTSSSSV